jgi:glyoxylase-like metal-dependent hydrolase (beta-lactamase superfamily II)
MIRLHHLNCISTCPVGGWLMDGRSPTLVQRGELACHCILAELPDMLVLIDTGLGRNDVANPRSRLSGMFLAMLRPDFRDEMTAYRQISALGFDPRDVRHIVLTHLDFDHAGGLDDFPWAAVHLLRAEKDYAARQLTWLDRQRFRPQQWSTAANWRTYSPLEGDVWHGLQRVHQLHGLPPEIAMVPLPGHTFGHAGVAIQHGNGKWLMQAGDAYFYRGEMDLERPRCTPGLRFYQWMLEKDRKARFASQHALRALLAREGSQIGVCCGHDVIEFERLAGHSARVPPSALVPAM